MRIRSYSELRRLETFNERFEYLNLKGQVGEKTFGSERYVNQKFYRSAQWKSIRHHVIARDLGMDLGIDGFEIHGPILIHHMNPMIVTDLLDFNPDVIDPEYLITTVHKTHNAIHYGDSSLLTQTLIERRPGDTTLW